MKHLTLIWILLFGGCIGTPSELKGREVLKSSGIKFFSTSQNHKATYYGAVVYFELFPDKNNPFKEDYLGEKNKVDELFED